VFQTYKEVNARLTDFGSGLLYLSDTVLNRNGRLGWHLGLYSINRPEWVIAEQAANAYSLVTVALYDTLGADTLTFTVNHADLEIIVCSVDKIPNLLKAASSCPKLKIIISMDDLAPGQATNVLKQWAEEKNIALYSFNEVEALGKKQPRAHVPPQPEDITTICYTSGTTGEPKGVMVLHKNFIAAAASISYHGISLSSDEVFISYLPLAHCFERVLQISMFNVGASIGFYRGDVLLLIEDISALRPTFFPSVPRLFNRIYGKLVDGTIKAPGLRGMLFRKAVGDKLANLKAGNGLNHFFWDRLLFSRVAAVLGGRVKMMITGSAPIAGDVLNFLRVCFSCDIVEGYGQTECAAGSTITFPGDYVTHQVGVPLACNEIKLVDVPEMGYLSTDKLPRGEVCIRGYNVMKGYYKDPKKTAETIDQDGWLHTGDIGVITENGCLAIIDRKKNIFKLAQGEYVAPEKLESLYGKSSLIMQSFVHGDSLQSELVAIVVPEPIALAEWAKKNLPNGGGFSHAELCKRQEVRALILDEIIRVGKTFKLSGFELAKNVHLEPEQFSVENELLTPSFKLKRNIAVKKYRAVIDKLYEELAKLKAAVGETKSML
jgi:long-chain acyl-CoA synthetase